MQGNMSKEDASGQPQDSLLC